LSQTMTSNPRMTQQYCEHSNNVQRHVRKRLRCKSPDLCLPLKSVTTFTDKCRDETRLRPVRRRMRCKSPGLWSTLEPAANLSDKCRSETQQRPRWRRARSMSRDLLRLNEPAATVVNNRCDSGAQRTPPWRVGRAKRDVPSGQLSLESSQQGSLALALLTTPEWRELCRKRGLTGVGSRKELAHQVWQQTTAARMTVAVGRQASKM